ncbi:MAG: hypothetical protein WCG48_04355 [Candidatus Berkelbacteria bacterium]
MNDLEASKPIFLYTEKTGGKKNIPYYAAVPEFSSTSEPATWTG